MKQPSKQFLDLCLKRNFQWNTAVLSQSEVVIVFLSKGIMLIHTFFFLWIFFYMFSASAAKVRTKWNFRSQTPNNLTPVQWHTCIHGQHTLTFCLDKCLSISQSSSFEKACSHVMKSPLEWCHLLSLIRIILSEQKETRAYKLIVKGTKHKTD